MSISAATFDLSAMVLLGLAVLWGLLRGPRGPVYALVALLLAMPAAGWLGARLEQPVAQVLTLGEPDRAPVAWAVALVALLLAASLLARSVTGLLPFRGRSGWGWRVLGAAVGIPLGVLLATLLGYGAAAAAPDAWAQAWGRESRVLPALRPVREALAQALLLPDCTDATSERVEALVPGGG